MAFRNAVHCNIKADEFWELTPKELNIIIEVYSEKHRNKLKENITVAFYNAYFQRVKTLSNMELKKILKNIGSQQMTDEEMYGVVKALNSNYGGDG